jgi:DNA-binding NtrC family response regulator
VRLPTLYLDTSVLGGYFDEEWKEPTRQLWRQMEAGQWCFQSSAITLDELTHAPGNVRELRNFIESMVVLDLDGVLDTDDVQDGEIMPRQGGAAAGSGSENTLVGRPLAEVERFYMERALDLTGGNREEAARLLGVGERTLYRKLREYEGDAVEGGEAGADSFDDT